MGGLGRVQWAKVAGTWDGIARDHDLGVRLHFTEVQRTLLSGAAELGLDLHLAFAVGV